MWQRLAANQAAPGVHRRAGERRGRRDRAAARLFSPSAGSAAPSFLLTVPVTFFAKRSARPDHAIWQADLVGLAKKGEQRATCLNQAVLVFLGLSISPREKQRV